MRNMLYWKTQPEDEGRVSMGDASLGNLVKSSIKSYLGILSVYLVVHWLASSMYYGPNFKRVDYIHNTDVKIIDLDGGFVGGNLTQLMLSNANKPEEPSWAVYDGVSTIDEAKEYVRKHGWGAVVIHPGLTKRFTDALYTGAEYNPKDAMTSIVSTGRGPMGTLLYTQPSLAKVTMKAATMFSAATLQRYKQMAASGMPVEKATFAAVFNPISVNSAEVSPFFFPISIVTSTFIFFVCLACALGPMISWKFTTFELFRNIRYRDLAMLWIGLLYVWIFVFSLFGSFAFLAYKGPTYGTGVDSLPYVASNFFSIWFTTYGSVLATALWIFALYVVAAPVFVGAASMCTIFPNMASTLLPLEMMPKVFRAYNALPFYNGTMLIRTITSGAYPHVGRNVAIIVGEVVFSTILLATTVWLRQYFVLNGISDVVGNYRGSPFFKTPIPYYKDTDAKSDLETAKLVAEERAATN
ncbi:hypothetical protein GQ54DRAFT_294716 [Martensiomyces pterosporus]|nr:hypothetical protein GQ54DRAFT_294716 [Martensiomyces pterosporus]